MFDLPTAIKVGLEERNMLQKDFAIELGISEVHMSNLMRNVKSTSFERMEQMADVFDVSINEFIEWGME